MNGDPWGLTQARPLKSRSISMENPKWRKREWRESFWYLGTREKRSPCHFGCSAGNGEDTGGHRRTRE